MGKPLSRPGCLRQSPCCSKKGDDREGYNEDGYIPQRSIYDTMCINEQIDHSSAHSTLGSRRGRETDFSSNGSLGAGGDMFDTRSSMLGSGGRKLDERFIFDSLKLANDELNRSPRGFVRSASPSVSCSSAPSGSVNKRHHHQDSSKKDNLCRHSWKVLSPPKFPEPVELSPCEKNYLNPGVVFFPNSITSPQISPFSGSPFSTGTHTPSVFFSPSPLPFHQQFHRQSLPIQPSSPRPPLAELSVTALICDQGDHIGDIQYIRDEGNTAKDHLFLTFKPKNVEPERVLPPTTPEPENDTTPLLRSQTTKKPAITPTSMESTWPRRLIGRRRTVRQGGAVHNLPILPPLPSLLFRSVSDKKTIPRLSPFPEHQGNVDRQPERSTLTRELKDCSLQDWKMLREQEESQNESLMEDALEGCSKMAAIQESAEPVTEEKPAFGGEEENWEAVLEMVNSLWDETWNVDPQSVGSLRRWPLLHPPSGFGGSQAPSCTSSELGAEDMLEIERMNREVVESQDDEEPDFQYNLQACKSQTNTVVTQPGHKLIHTKVPTSLDLASIYAQMENKYSHSESPDSALTLDSESSGIYMSNPSQTSREDITPDNDRPLSDVGLGSTTSLSQGEEMMDDERKIETSVPKVNKVVTIYTKQRSGLRSNSVIESRRQALCKEISTKAAEIKERLKPVDKGTVSQEMHYTVNTSESDVPLPLSPSKHEVKPNLLGNTDTDSFVATDSFVYLAVSVPPIPSVRQNVTKPAVEEPSPPTSFTKPCPYPDECDFLSTDSFVYLAAPDCHLLVTEGHSVYGDSKDSESDDSGSKADYVLASAVGGDSDWDSDLTDSDPEPNSSKSAWDCWEELEQGVLPELFGEDQSDEDKLLHGNRAQQICCQHGELAAIVLQERVELEEVSSQYTQGAETHTEVKSVS
ncbi:uncharacterized protein LOC130436409 [Triplophysa dalaica]|uniref:uncharacterized protein LOC130436409 n=1 Tax=Triplophysa dalaica TaxID=1582913 RepID=UPI0024E00A84|nr:uncharacterized protein LOC130436409 [Triplophysa dalaica]